MNKFHGSTRRSSGHNDLEQMISAVYVLDAKGKVLISRDYRGDVTPKHLERFVSHILEVEEANIKPVFEIDGVNYLFVKYNGLYCT